MVTIRPYRPVEDRERVASLDTTFTTDRIYRLKREHLAFSLEVETISPALHKDYHLADDMDELSACHYAVVAEQDGRIVGLAAVKHEAWNNRSVIWHLYVAPACRGLGIGRVLVDACEAYARSGKMRCLWLETQTINYPAIQFYQQLGFKCCGFDSELYEPSMVGKDEIALYFARPIR